MKIVSCIEVVFICFIIFFFKILVFPIKGSGITDTSIFGLNYNLSIFYLLLIFIVSIILSILLLRKKKYDCYSMGVFFNLFIILAFISNFYANHTYFFYGIFVLNNLFVFFFIYLFVVNFIIKFNYFIYLFVFILFVYVCVIISNIDFSRRLDVFFMHPNHLGNVLAFGILFLIFLTLSVRNMVMKLIIWSMIFVFSLGLIATISKGAWLGLLFGLIIGIILWFVFNIKNKKNNILIFKTLIVLFLFAVISIFIIQPKNINERFDLKVKDTEVSTMNRVILWKTSLKIIKEHPFFGVGLGNFGYVLEKDYKTRFLNGETFSSALNNYLTLAAEAGIPTLILYLIIIGYAIYLSIKSIFSKNNVDYNLISENKYLQGFYNFFYINDFTLVKIGLLAGIISMLVFGLTTYTLTRVYSNLLIWSSFGYIITSDIKDDKSEKEENI